MSAFTEDMLKSMAKVEATRAQRLHASIKRFTAEEKDELLKEFHPDYSSIQGFGGWSKQGTEGAGRIGTAAGRQKPPAGCRA